MDLHRRILLGSLTFSTPITALILTTAGLNRKAVVGWAIASSLLTWGVTLLVYEAGYWTTSSTKSADCSECSTRPRCRTIRALVLGTL